jgi:phage tail-like protein
MTMSTVVSMNGSHPTLPVSHPIIEMLPGVFQEDDFARRLTNGLDAVLAPVYMCLDGLESYIDARLCPDDFLPWLASWVGVLLDENWPQEKQREFIQAAVPLFRWRGTSRGLRQEVEILTGGVVEIAETGGVTVSNRPAGTLPGENYPRCTVRVTLPADSPISDQSINLIIDAAKPAHVIHAVEIVRK